jgi:hypothetical protein
MITKFKIFENKHIFKEGDYVVVDNLNKDTDYLQKLSDDLINYLKYKVGIILEIEPYHKNSFDFLYIGYLDVPKELKKSDIYYRDYYEYTIYLVQTDETRLATKEEIEKEKLNVNINKYNI